MKRITALLLVLIMVLSLAACGSGTTLYGTWEPVSITINGANFTLDEMAALGDDEFQNFSLVIKEGGVAYISNGEDGEMIDWEETEDGFEIGDVKGKIEKGLLYISDNDEKIICFKKTSNSQSIVSDSGSKSTPEPDAAKGPSSGSRPNSSKGAPTEFDTSGTIEETVLYDENDVKITATELVYNKNSAKLNLLIENNSDRALRFHSGTTDLGSNSINGYMFSGSYLSCDIAAGKKANDNLSFDYDYLSILGIYSIADIELAFEIRDDNFDEFYTGLIPIKTSLADSYDYSVDTFQNSINNKDFQNSMGLSVDYFSDETLFDQHDVSIVSAAMLTNRNDEKIILFEVENNSDRIISVGSGDIAINGLVVQSGNWSSDSVNPGKRCLADLSFDSLVEFSQMSSFGIDEITSIDFKLTLRDTDYDTIADGMINITISNKSSKLDLDGDEVYNEDGIRVVSKGIVEDSHDYSDDLHWLLLVENNSGIIIDVSDAYDSLSVNGYMVNFIMYSAELQPGTSAILDIEIMGYDLDNNGISGISDITEAEIKLEIRNTDYSLIATPILYITL